jgi:predicted RNA binding protein YcfA (HicA-like mRNA interferase family)
MGIVKFYSPFDYSYSIGYTSIVASEKRFSIVKKMLEQKGYQLVRTSGSHHVFEKPGTGIFVVPVHNGKVKPFYVRQIEKIG